MKKQIKLFIGLIVALAVLLIILFVVRRLNSNQPDITYYSKDGQKVTLFMVKEDDVTDFKLTDFSGNTLSMSDFTEDDQQKIIKKISHLEIYDGFPKTEMEEELPEQFACEIRVITLDYFTTFTIYPAPSTDGKYTYAVVNSDESTVYLSDGNWVEFYETFML